MPENNPRLKAAIVAARDANMPKDTMERAIKRGAGGGDDTNYEEVRYEGYGPGGVAIIVEALTDNRNRTASEIRAAFSKLGGSLGEAFAQKDRLVFLDIITDQTENVFPMVPGGKGMSEMILAEDL